MLSSATPPCRLAFDMAPTASWSGGANSNNVINITSSNKPKRPPISILKKADSDTSSTCSNSSMVMCRNGCRLKIPNIHISSHNCVEHLREELNDAFCKIDDLEERLKLQGEAHLETEQVLRRQIKRLRGELDDGQRTSLQITRENGTFGFKLLGRPEGDNGEEGVVVSSLTLGCPAEKSGKMYIWDKILEINDVDVSCSTCGEVETLIRNSQNTMNLVLMRTIQSTQFQPPRTQPRSPGHIHCPAPLYSPVLPPTLSKSFNPQPSSRRMSLNQSATPQSLCLADHNCLPVHSASPSTLPTRLISDDDFDSLSGIGLENLDSSQDKSSEVSELSVEQNSPGVTYNVSGPDVTDIVDIMTDNREYEEITLTKVNGVLGITLTYGTDLLQGILFVDSIRDNSPAQLAGKPLLHDQILKINGNEVGVDVMCDEAVSLLTDENDTVTLELARPKKHVVTVRRNLGESLGMMVAVSKIEDDKSVIISTVDPNGIVARYGLFKGLTLEKVNDTNLVGVGLKRAVEIIAGAVGDIALTVYLHPSFSPYQPPRPPTPYPLRENGDGLAVDLSESEEEITERSVKFSLPPSPARSNSTTNSIDSIPHDSRAKYQASPKSRSNEELYKNSKQATYKTGSLEGTPYKGRSPNTSLDVNDPRCFALPKPFPRGYGSPSMNLINNDWSLDRSLTSDPGAPFRAIKVAGRDQMRGPVRVSHRVLSSAVLPMKVSLYNNNSVSSLETDSEVGYSIPNYRGNPSPTHIPIYENIRPSPVDYENVVRHPDYNKQSPSRDQTPRSATDRGPLPRPGSNHGVPPSPRHSVGSQGAPPHPIQSTNPPHTLHRPRVIGRRERAAISGDRKVQLGTFKPINADDEHYV